MKENGLKQLIANKFYICEEDIFVKFTQFEEHTIIKILVEEPTWETRDILIKTDFDYDFMKDISEFINFGNQKSNIFCPHVYQTCKRLLFIYLW